MFILFASLLAWFSTVRRRIEQQLLQSNDQLGREVAERTRQAALLEHTAIEIRTLNQDLAARSRELEASNKELEAFAYSVSHDLRAPLRHMVGYAELLQKHESSIVDDTGSKYMLSILDAQAEIEIGATEGKGNEVVVFKSSGSAARSEIASSGRARGAAAD
jgi:signal transduction histidine kinase